ncbi:MAG: hypothetical protein V1792_18685 [Pseudomonadota bacterium]
MTELAQELDQSRLKRASRRTSPSIRDHKWILLGPVLVLLLIGYGFADDIWQAPPDQPEQMSSKVHYDPNLTDRFFESDEWVCPPGFGGAITCRDGKPILILNDPCHSWLSLLMMENCVEPREWTCPDGCKECATCRDGRPVIKMTAKCHSTYRGKHLVDLCKARLLDGEVLEILIYNSGPAFMDSLLVRISGGEFTCQFWSLFDFGAVRWTTTQQKLTLDRKTYRKGDVIKGRIDFACWSELHQPHPASPPHKTNVYGVFKTIVE